MTDTDQSDLHRNAAALIRQLVAERDALQGRVDILTQERDAAVASWEPYTEPKGSS